MEKWEVRLLKYEIIINVFYVKYTCKPLSLDPTAAFVPRILFCEVQKILKLYYKLLAWFFLSLGQWCWLQALTLTAKFMALALFINGFPWPWRLCSWPWRLWPWSCCPNQNPGNSTSKSSLFHSRFTANLWKRYKFVIFKVCRNFLQRVDVFVSSGAFEN